MKDKEISEFAKSRDEAIISFVTEDSLEKFYRHCEKYGIELPNDENVMKAGIYKAVQECTDISDDVKTTAAIKCMMLGFQPFADWSRYASAD